MLTEQDRAVLAEWYIDIPWLVCLNGISTVITCPCLCLPREGCTKVFDREAAFAFASSVGRTASTSGPALPADTVTVTPYVVHYGVVWGQP
jgi:hypothetical protein